ncbi:MAG: hypothetical protein ING40_08960 [Burkholderiales bacterium]|nr:hypothetical protein [Burkholderiales bacterium]
MNTLERMLIVSLAAALVGGCGGSDERVPSADQALRPEAAAATPGAGSELSLRTTGPVAISSRAARPAQSPTSVGQGSASSDARVLSSARSTSANPRSMMAPQASVPLTSGWMVSGTLATGLVPEVDEQQPTYAAWVGRVTAGGAVDSGFAGGGFVYLPQGFIKAEGTALAVDSSGRTLLAVTALNESRTSVVRLLRLTTAGQLDGSFGSGGVAEVAGGTRAARIARIRVLDSGQILVFGDRLAVSPGFSRTPFLAAFTSNGSKDASFGSDGTWSLGGLSPSGRAIDMDRDASGRLLVLVAAVSGSEGATADVLRILPGGTLDASFGTGGVARLRLTNSASVPFGLGARSDGGLIVAGSAISAAAGTTATRRVFFARLGSSGSLDTSFGTNGYAVITTQAAVLEPLGAVIPPSGSVALVGNAAEAGQGRPLLAAVLSSGQPDTALGPSGYKLLSDPLLDQRRVLSAVPSADRRGLFLNALKIERASAAMPVLELVSVNNVTRDDTPAGVKTCVGPFAGLGKPVVEIRGGKPGAAEWEFGLGADTQSAAKFVKGEHTWQSGAWLPFSLIINAQGNATLTYGSTTLQYAATQAGPIGVGNAVRIYIKASGTTPPSSVAVRVVRINDHSGLSQAVNTAPNSTVFNDASLALSYPASATSLQVDGEVQLNFVGTVPSGSRLGATVTTGNCN